MSHDTQILILIAFVGFIPTMAFIGAVLDLDNKWK